MHAGHMVEDADTPTLLANPRHPYTARLIAATPTVAGSTAAPCSPCRAAFPTFDPANCRRAGTRPAANAG